MPRLHNAQAGNGVTTGLKLQMRPSRPPDAGQVVGKTAPQTAPPLIEAQSTAGAIANGASRYISRDGGI